METLQQSGAVALVLALLLLTLWWLRRRGLAGLAGSLPMVRKTNAPAPGKPGASAAGSATYLAPDTARRRGLADFGVSLRLCAGTSHGLARNRKHRGRALKRLACLFAVSALPAFTAASEPFSLLGISAGKGGASLSVPMQILILLTLLTLLPGAIMAMTPFLRITIVLHFLRQALGTQTTPSNQVLLGLALFLTIVIMQPVAADMYHHGWEPLEAGQITDQQAMEKAVQAAAQVSGPLRPEKDIAYSLRSPIRRPLARPPMSICKILIPAYILSELKTGFQIGAVLFLPFLVIDLVVASVTSRSGMMQLPPVMISAPFKILLFVLVDGWNLVVGSLMKSFSTQ